MREKGEPTRALTLCVDGTSTRPLPSKSAKAPRLASPLAVEMKLALIVNWRPPSFLSILKPLEVFTCRGRGRRGGGEDGRRVDGGRGDGRDGGGAG